MDEPTPFLPGELIAHVARLASASLEEVRSKDRRRELVRIRAVASVLLRKRIVDGRPMSFAKIGGYMGRDRSTIQHHVGLFPYVYARDEEAQYMLMHANERFFLS